MHYTKHVSRSRLRPKRIDMYIHLGVLHGVCITSQGVPKYTQETTQKYVFAHFLEPTSVAFLFLFCAVGSSIYGDNLLHCRIVKDNIA